MDPWLIKDAGYLGVALMVLSGVAWLFPAEWSRKFRKALDLVGLCGLVLYMLSILWLMTFMVTMPEAFMESVENMPHFP